MDCLRFCPLWGPRCCSVLGITSRSITAVANGIPAGDPLRLPWGAGLVWPLVEFHSSCLAATFDCIVVSAQAISQNVIPNYRQPWCEACVSHSTGSVCPRESDHSTACRRSVFHHDWDTYHTRPWGAPAPHTHRPSCAARPPGPGASMVVSKKWESKVPHIGNRHKQIEIQRFEDWSWQKCKLRVHMGREGT